MEKQPRKTEDPEVLQATYVWKTHIRTTKIWFSSILETFPPKQCWFSYFLERTDHSAYIPLGARELTLAANEIEKEVKY